MLICFRIEDGAVNATEAATYLTTVADEVCLKSLEMIAPELRILLRSPEKGAECMHQPRVPLRHQYNISLNNGYETMISRASWRWRVDEVQGEIRQAAELKTGSLNAELRSKRS